jgi:hypothetical protein
MTCFGISNGRTGHLPICPQSSYCSGYLKFFVLITLFIHHCLYFLTDSTLSYNIPQFLLRSNKLCPAVCLMNFISAVFSLLVSMFIFYSRIKFMGEVKYCTLFFKRGCPLIKFEFNLLFKISNICKMFLFFSYLLFLFL